MTDFRERLGTQLDTAFERQTSRRRTTRNRVAAGTAVLLVVMGSLLVISAVRSSPAAAAIDVETVGHLVYVRLGDKEFDAGAIERAVRGAGLDIDVSAVPVGPSLVGRFVRDQIDGPDLGTLRRLDEDGDSFAGFVVPAGWDGHLRIDVGRPADDGEGYVVASNAISEGEPLACADVIGRSPEEASHGFADAGVSATWRGTVDGREVIIDDVLGPAWRDQLVAHVLAFSPTSVVAYVSADGEPDRLDLRLTAPARCEGGAA